MAGQSMRERERIMSPVSGMHWTKLAEKYARDISSASSDPLGHKVYIPVHSEVDLK